MTQRGDKGERLPVAVKELRGQPLSSRPPAAQRGHVRLDPALIEKDQPASGDTVLMGFPAPALAGDLRAILFGGQRGFFVSARSGNRASPLTQRLHPTAYFSSAGFKFKTEDGTVKEFAMVKLQFNAARCV